MTKPRPVNWQLIDDQSINNISQNLISKYHSGRDRLDNINIVYMWKHNVKPDQDGYLVITDISKSSDKVKELRPHDMIIGINKVVWSLLNDAQKNVVIDSQLERIAPCLDKDGNPKEDDKFRPIYRLRRPETLEDEKLVSRHGLNMQSVQSYVFDKLSGSYERDSYIGTTMRENK